MKQFDYFVIGGGSGGVRSARIAATHGATVGLAEKAALGGTCVNVGCVPKKLFTYAAGYGDALNEMAGYGWEVSDATFNWSTLLKNKSEEITRLNGVYKKILNTSGVTVFDGAARFIDSNILEINGEKIRAETILIATGGRPRRPNIQGAEHCLMSDDIFSITKFPQRILIQGGGYIGVEFSHIFHALGAEVTLVTRSETLLRGFDSDIIMSLYAAYTRQGLDVRLSCDLISVQKDENGHYLVQLSDGSALTYDLVLSAIGRTPYSDELSLERAGVTTGPDGRILVDENTWQTSAANIYAVGDVSNAHNLTPYAIAEGHILADRLFGTGPARDVRLDLVPTAVFSGPPIGTVGLSEEAAKERGYEVQIFKTSFRPLRHTLSGAPHQTMMKLVVCARSQRVLGCHMLGEDTPEILQGVAIAMNMGATKADFDRTIGIHPTAAEELVTLK